MAVLETPWFMKTKTSDIGRVNSVFEDRFQKAVTLIDIKQRKSLTKIDDEIKDIRKEFRRIRTEVDFSTDLDEHGKPLYPDGLRSADQARGSHDAKKLRTRSAVNRSRKFAMMAHQNRKKLTPAQVSALLEEKFSKQNEMQRLQQSLQDSVIHPRKPRKKKKRKSTKPELELDHISPILPVDTPVHVPMLNGLDESDEHLPEISDFVKDTPKDRRFSISSPRKPSRDHLPDISSVQKKGPLRDRKRSLEF